MAKNSGSTRTSSTSGGIKISTDFTGAKYAEGVVHRNDQVARIAGELHGYISTGGGTNSIAFSRDTSNATIRSYVKDVEALNGIYDTYRSELKAIPRGLSYQERDARELAIEERYESNLRAYRDKRLKELR